MATQRALVTGAFGFLGRRFCEIASLKNEMVCHRLPREVDICNADALANFCKDLPTMNYIFHFADVNPTIRSSRSDRLSVMCENILMSINMARLWNNRFNDAKFVGFDTAWAYPANLELIDETQYWSGEMATDAAHYGISKKVLSVAIANQANNDGMQGTMMLLGNVYGPNDKSNRIVPTVLRQMQNGKSEITLHTDGYEERDFTFIDDQIHGILMNKDVNVQRLNVSSGQVHTVRDLVTKAKTVTNFSGEVRFAYTVQKTVSRKMRLDRVRSATGWPDNYNFTPLIEGLKKSLTPSNINN